jgi:16S rRNA (cytosine967-C5)-methyltransferase
MTPGARVAAAIEILDLIIAATRDNGPSADKVVSDYFKTRRYAGSKDRRAVRELTWEGVRRFGNRPESARAVLAAMADDDADLTALFNGDGHAPAPILADEPRATGGPLPDWVMPQLARPEGGIDTDALLNRAPLDIRINTLKADHADVASRWPEAVALPDAPKALRLPTGQSVEGQPDYLSGHIEIQDYGSQLIALACAARPGMTVLDLCAGAGGKTLALAADMAGEGHLIAADTSRARLGELPKRATRAGAAIETRLLNGGQEREGLADLHQGCDVVLIDAPCSGTGTWRRNPETRWRLTPERLADLVKTQAMLLAMGSDLVRLGGVLVYAVCALTEAEGRAQVDDFLGHNTAFMPDALPFSAGRDYGAGRLLTPCHDSSDGFYLARLKKIG